MRELAGISTTTATPITSLTEEQRRQRRLAGLPEIVESSTKKQLVEVSPAPLALLLQEVAGQPLRIHGILNKASVVNSNGRRYSRELLQREAQKLNSRIAGGEPIYGLLDHPSDSVAKLRDAAIAWRRFEMRGDELHGDGEILSGTAAGNTLKKVLDASGRVSLSARGFGTTKPGADGAQEVQPDYDFQGADAVIGGSAPGAYAEVMA